MNNVLPRIDSRFLLLQARRSAAETQPAHANLDVPVVKPSGARTSSLLWNQYQSVGQMHASFATQNILKTSATATPHNANLQKALASDLYAQDDVPLYENTF